MLAAHLSSGPASPTALQLGDPPRQVIVDVRSSQDSQVAYLQTQAGDEAELLKRVIATRRTRSATLSPC